MDKLKIIEYFKEFSKEKIYCSNCLYFNNECLSNIKCPEFEKFIKEKHNQ